MNDRLEKQEVRKEELRQIIETLLKSDQWKYIMATSGTGFDFSENNPTMQEVNPKTFTENWVSKQSFFCFDIDNGLN